MSNHYQLVPYDYEGEFETIVIHVKLDISMGKHCKNRFGYVITYGDDCMYTYGDYPDTIEYMHLDDNMQNEIVDVLIHDIIEDNVCACVEFRKYEKFYFDFEELEDGDFCCMEYDAKFIKF